MPQVSAKDILFVKTSVKHFLTIQNKFKLYFNGSLFVYSDAGMSAIETERKDESLCHSDSNRTLHCPDDYFIDMFHGGEHSPLAVFIPDYSCPEASDRQSVLSNIYPAYLSNFPEPGPELRQLTSCTLEF